MFTGISNIEEVAFNALSFIWNPHEEAKVNKIPTKKKIPRQCEQVKDLEGKKKRKKERQEEWLRREGKNPRNAFWPRGSVTTAKGQFSFPCGPKALGVGLRVKKPAAGRANQEDETQFPSRRTIKGTKKCVV